MRRTAVILAVVILLALSQAAQAVEVEAGWYVKFGEISLQGYYGPDEWVENWYPESALGQSGILFVEEGTPFWRSRKTTVTADTYVEPGVLFEDYGSYAGQYPYYQLVNMAWETDYDATRVQLRVFRHRGGGADELIWSQTQSGYAVGGANIWNSYPLQDGEQIVVRLVAIPEPSSLAGISAAVVWCLILRRRSR